MLLSVRNLRSSFFLDEGELRAVDGISFDLDEGETLGLVGESGCGKTIVALSILDLIPPPGRVVSGQILFEGQNILKMSADDLRKVRGGGIGLVFQEPSAALNPVHSIGRQISDVLSLHHLISHQEAWRRAVQLLGEMGIPEPEKRAKSYPFELSGGMQQRALIAIALAGRPKILIADEPTTALDVTVQAEILALLGYLQDQYRMSILIISHDLEMVAELTDRLMVMYTGRILEEADTGVLLASPKHPYTKGLLAAIPRLGAGSETPLQEIPGSVPDLMDLPSGCSFHPRCGVKEEECTSRVPDLLQINHHRRCACFRVAGN